MVLSTAIDASAVARVTGVQTRYRDLRGGNTNFLPQRIAVLGQGNEAVTYTTTPKQVFTAQEVGEEFGYGSPLHLAVKELFPITGDTVGIVPVTIYPMQKGASAAAATHTITCAGTQVNAGNYVFRIGGVSSQSFRLEAAATATEAGAALANAINAVVDMPVTAAASTGTVTLTAKWQGLSGNDIRSVLQSGTVSGITFTITTPTNGAVDPDVATTLAQISTVWETFVVNTLQPTSAIFTLYQTWGDGRLDPTIVRTPVVLSGTVDTLTNLTTLGNGRKSDRINAVIPVQGSSHLPLQIAARAASRIGRSANNNPAQDYAGLSLTGITPGASSDDWTYSQREAAVNAGISTVEIIDGVPQLSDVVTFYHPDGEVPPAFRYVVDIVKLQNLQYRIQLTFATNEWRGAPLLPDPDVTTNPLAKKPKDAVAALAGVVRQSGLDALISDAEGALQTIQAGINAQNPKRLDATLSVKLSGNTNIISTDLNFGFFFGGSV